ncbi:metallophosphoesterase [Solibacillus sp. FSL W7-1464]|uniref:metallophosphoesterase n=1 Tax=Solibacillus sp. FSL W7-1464 TaxID=2921706 RepID=UPI0030F7015C
MVIISSIGIACILVLLYMFKEAHENNIRSHEVKANGDMETIHLFFISDTHARKINKGMIHSIDQDIDAVLIGGDFVDRRTSEETVLHNIRMLTKLGPTYFIWGNNDIEFGESKLRQLLADHHIRIIENGSIKLKSKNDVSLSAVSYSPGDQNMNRAIEQCEERNTVFVAHNPELFRKVHKHFQPLLSIGAHLHGGQIRLGKFGVQPHGYFKKIKNRYELVSNGYGTTLIPLRLCAKPESHLITIKFKKDEWE